MLRQQYRVQTMVAWTRVGAEEVGSWICSKGEPMGFADGLGKAYEGKRKMKEIAKGQA